MDVDVEKIPVLNKEVFEGESRSEIDLWLEFFRERTEGIVYNDTSIFEGGDHLRRWRSSSRVEIVLRRGFCCWNKSSSE